MYYLAFDVSKHSLDGVLTNLRKKYVYFHIPNSCESIEAWLANQALPGKLTAGCEATGGYHLTLAHVFAQRGYAFRIINPILTKQFLRSTIRKKKTDISDSVVIAKLLAQGEGEAVSKDADITPKIEQRMLTKLIRASVRFELMRQSLELPNQNEALGALNKRLHELHVTVREAADDHRKSLRRKYADHHVLRLPQSIPGITAVRLGLGHPELSTCCDMTPWRVA
jgi:transposase